MAADANIPVVEVNTETTSTDYVSYIGSNDSEAGEMMGDYVMEQLGEDGGQFVGIIAFVQLWVRVRSYFVIRD